MDKARERQVTVLAGRASAALEGWACIALVVVTPLLFVRSTFTVFAIPKATFVVLVAAILVTAEAATVVAWGVLRRLDRRIEVLSGLLVLAVMVATMASEVPAVALTGVGVRYSGAITYLAYAVILRASARGLSGNLVRHLMPAFGGAGLVVIGYALLQAAGRDPLSWAPSLSYGVVTLSTLGNPNFSAAFTAITLPFLVGLLLSSGRPVAVRLVAAVAITPALAALGYFSSLQGQVAILTTGVVLLSWLWGRTGRVLGESVLVCLVVVSYLGIGPLVADRSWLLVMVGAFLMSVVVMVLIGRERAWGEDALPVDEAWGRAGRRSMLLGIAVVPVVVAVVAQGWGRIARALGERMWFWDVGVRMFLDRPLFGNGLETYGTRFAELRPTGHALVSPTHLSNSVHSVPLGLLLGGGLVLGAVYVAINGLAAWCGVRIIRRASGDDRICLASVAAAWLAFHLQSLVSVDVAGLGVLYWILTGVLLGHGLGGRVRSVALPWISRGRELSRSRIGVFVAVSAVLVATWSGPVLAPLRADRYHHHAMLALARSEPAVALARIEEARRLQPSNAIYAKMVAAIYRSAGRYPEALEMSEQAAELQPGNPQLALEAARDAVRVIGGSDNLGRAIRWYGEVVRIDPLGPGRLEAAYFFEAIGRHDRAEEARYGQGAGPESGDSVSVARPESTMRST